MSEQEAKADPADDLQAAQAAAQTEATRAAATEAAEDGSEGSPATSPPGDTRDPEDAEQVEEAVAEEDPRTRGELAAALAEAESQRDEFLADLQRLQAEFDNFRKRTMREGATQRAAGVADLTGKLLDVLDDFDMALMSVASRPASTEGDGDDVTSLHKGLELVYSKLISVLKSSGLERIDEEGVAFDPEQHEAVQQVPADEGPLDEPRVVDVLRPGYRIEGRVIRAAMVKVEQ